ncbi:MAG: GntR family transcriptional regulator [Acidimicrobiales bacterium]|nr:GntR family transcriptional regulator [Acidimicrobiales bacterium]
MILDVETTSAVPPYEQIRAQITALIMTGALAVGDRLPSIRQLAGDLGLAPGTVARAYRELEQTGLVASRGRHGTVVTDPAHARAPAPDPSHLDEAAATFAAAAGRSGSSLDEAIEAVRRAFEHMQRRTLDATEGRA